MTGFKRVAVVRANAKRVLDAAPERPLPVCGDREGEPKLNI